MSGFDAIQNFYGKVIRENKREIQENEQELWAFSDHYSNTPENPKHSICPKGERFWYTFQRCIATEKKTYKPIKWSLSQAIIDAVHPIFIGLTNEGFIDRCKQGYTQNVTESFNTLIWNLSPKEKCNSSLETLTARFFSTQWRGAMCNFVLKYSVWNITLFMICIRTISLIIECTKTTGGVSVLVNLWTNGFHIC